MWLALSIFWLCAVFRAARSTVFIGMDFISSFNVTTFIGLLFANLDRDANDVFFSLVQNQVACVEKNGRGV